MAAGTRTIALTGATRGCGRALVERFVEAGHVVHGCGTSVERVDELASLHGPPHSFVPLDVRDAGAVSAWAARVVAAGGTPDLVINNAGRINANAPLWEVSPEELDEVVDVNLKGSVNVIRAFTPALIAAGGGLLVNMSSGWGRSAAPDVAPYCATKWGVEGLTRALAEELPAGMGAVAVNPGVIDTAMLRSCWGEGAGRCPDPDTWSRTAAPFLLGLTASDSGRSLDVR